MANVLRVRTHDTRECGHTDEKTSQVLEKEEVQKKYKEQVVSERGGTKEHLNLKAINSSTRCCNFQHT